jgi:hypothetical protein
MSENFLTALHADPWNNRLLDLPSLNARASDAVEAAVIQLQERARTEPSELRSVSQVYLGPPGAGKTHLFSRLRKRLGPRAVFVHIRPLLHAGLTPAFILNEAVMQLSQSSYGHSQAIALVGSLIGHTRQESAAFPMAHLMALQELSEKERKKSLEDALEKVLESFPDLDDVYIERLLNLPFCTSRERRATLAWLAGQDCDPSQLERIGAASSLGSEHAVRALRTLGCVASLGAPLVLVFDQLENLIQGDREEERINQYGNLISELVDATRGLLIVQMALDSEWEQGIETRLNLSQRSRVVMSKRSIALPTAQESHQLLEMWHGAIERPLRPLPWPFSDSELRRLLLLPGLTPRMLLSALSEARDGSPIGLLQESSTGESRHLDLNEVLNTEWSARNAAAHRIIDQVEERRGAIDSRRLSDGILTASTFDPSLALRSSGDDHIQIEAEDKSGRFLCILHQSHHSSVNATLDRVLALRTDKKGVVLREQWRPFSPSWKVTLQRQSEVLARDSITWFELSRQDTALLLALEDFVQASLSHDICDGIGRPVSPEAVRKFISSEIRPGDWSLLQALSSKTPNFVDGDQPDELEVTRQIDGVPAPIPIEPLDPSALTISPVQAIVQRLRVASLDRVIREALRINPDYGRTFVIRSLKAMGPTLKWHGRNIVALEEVQ